MRKLPLFKEALLSTALILITVFLIHFFPFKYELVKPIKQDFGDFDVYDLHYSGLRNDNTDPDIVLVQVGDSREEIRKQLEQLSVYQPAVIGIDVDFIGSSANPRTDSALKKKIHDMPEVVTGHRLVVDSRDRQLKPLHNYFDDDPAIMSRSGYFNFVGDEISVVRQYAPFMKLDTATDYALTSRMLEKFDSTRFSRLVKRDHKTESINYSGNTEHYLVINREELLNDTLYKLSGLMKGKIILMGVLHTIPPLLMEDIHFSPLNSKITGKSFPDMYGVIVHANVLSMLLSGNYIKSNSEKFTYLLSGILVFFMMLYQLKTHQRKKHLSHWKMILLQLFSILLVIYLFFLLFSYFHVKVILLPMIVAIVLSVELFGPYRKLTEWILRKIKFNRSMKNK